ncbi:MAG: adenylosuccinate synthase [Desulfovibrio sp.]|jgi:adenylosuccinate synthase|nr:adenylosuccinate synthase [Desulfovibrio sp.]
MSHLVVVGAQWGDEGKGKVVDLLAADIAAVVRFHGGNNAGHTVAAGGKTYILQLIPSGILHPGKICLIGNGVVVDPVALCREMDGLTGQGIDVSPARLKVSRKAHLIMPYHKALDQAREESRAEGRIGTTGRGIGPCYEDKAARIGVRACDLEDMDLLRRKAAQALREKNALLAGLYGKPPVSLDEVMTGMAAVAPRVLPHLADVSSELAACEASGGVLMFEGAQGVHLDVDHGTYPFVTSSNTVAGNIAAGAGIAPSRQGRIVGIVKAYTTRVGSGPFPTELCDATGDFLRRRGVEFGTITGRKRRCGWQDMVLVRESVRLCGITEIALTKLDVLSGLEELKICTSYEYRGQSILVPPQGENALEQVSPVYETMPGWLENIEAAAAWEDLPEAARAYILRLEALAGVPVSIVSIGPDRRQTLFR